MRGKRKHFPGYFLFQFSQSNEESGKAAGKCPAQKRNNSETSSITQDSGNRVSLHLESLSGKTAVCMHS